MKKKCSNPDCSNMFEPYSPAHRFCSSICRSRATVDRESHNRKAREQYARKKAGLVVPNKKVSAGVKRSYHQGTRLAVRDPIMAARRRSESLKKAYREGRHSSKGFTSEQAKKYSALADRDKRAEALRRNAKKRIGKPMPTGPSARGEAHWHAKYWVMKDENNKTHVCINLSHFVREHPDLFEPQYLLMNGTVPKAAKRIASAIQTGGSWKGWRGLTPEELEREKEIINGLLHMRESVRK